MKADLTAQKEKYTAKVMHGYYERKINKNTKIDKQLSNYWEKKICYVTTGRKLSFCNPRPRITHQIS